MKNNNKSLEHFQNEQLSAKAAGKVVGGAGSEEECMDLENQFEAAVARGDMAEARRIMRIMTRVCFTDGL